MSLPGLNYVVIDANKLTSKDTIGPLIAEYHASGQRLALPWVHLYEQSQGSSNWFDKVHRELRAEPQAIILGKPTFVLIAEERRTERRIHGLRHIEDRRKTLPFRAFLNDPSPTADLSNLRSFATGFFRGVHPPSWTKMLTNAVAVTDLEAKAIRRGLQNRDRTPLRAAVLEAYEPKTIERALLGLGLSRRDSARLSRFPSFSALTIVIHACFGLRMRMQPPAPGQLGVQDWEDNHAADIEGILISLYGRRFVSNDGFAKELHEDMRSIASDLWP
jgi:hypothetical protein